MKIQCPNCAYTREMDEARIPDGILTATCPSCGKTFRFSKSAPGGVDKPQAVRLSGADAPAAGGQTPGQTPGRAPGDEDLPQGAIVRESSPDPFARPLSQETQEKETQGKDAQTGDPRTSAQAPSSRARAAPEDGSRPAGQEQGDRSQAQDGGLENTTIKDAWKEYWREKGHGQEQGRQDARDRDPREDRGADQPYARRDQESDRGRDQDMEDGERWSFNPWECARSLQEFIPALYQTCLRVMFAPQRFFAEIGPRSVLLALGFFLSIVVLQTFVEHIWGLVFFKYVMPIETMSDPTLKELATLLANKGNLLVWLMLRCLMLLMQLYFYSGILYLCWKLIAPGHADFSVLLQVLCYAQAPIILCIIPGVGTIIGMIWSCLCALIGCRIALRLTWTQTMLGAAPLMILVLASYMHAFSIF